MKSSMERALKAMKTRLDSEYDQVSNLKLDEEAFLASLSSDSDKVEETEDLLQGLEELETLLEAATETLNTLLP